MICGNDFYSGPWSFEIQAAAEDFCELAQARCRHVFAILGMSAKTWQYTGARAPKYDAACLSLKRAFGDAGVAHASGFAELQGLKLADSIGHVHEESSSTIFAAYKSWVRQCVASECSRPHLPFQAEPPPPFSLRAHHQL